MRTVILDRALPPGSLDCKNGGGGQGSMVREGVRGVWSGGGKGQGSVKGTEDCSQGEGGDRGVW